MSETNDDKEKAKAERERLKREIHELEQKVFEKELVEETKPHQPETVNDDTEDS